MPIVTKTLTVNAAFLEEIKEDDRELRRLLDQARAALAQEPTESDACCWLVDLIVRLRDQFVVHFSLEEAFGYFEDPISVAPHLSGRAESLRAEHDVLRSEISAIAEMTGRLPESTDATAILREVGAKFDDFYRKFQRHERGEAELLVAAYHDDIGVGD